MKRILILPFLSASTLWGQFLPDIPDRLNYVGLFNGTSQYFSKTSPSNMDLNGSELITDPGFESGVWTDTADVAVLEQTTAQKHSGTYSMLLMPRATSLNAIARSPNITNATVNGTTPKVTAEFWVYAPTGNTSKTAIYRIVNQSNVNLALGSTAVTGNTWTKLVINFQLPGTQSGVKLFVGLSATSALTDSLYVDDVSLTQAYDGIVSLEAKTTSGSTQTLAGSSKSNGSRLRIWQNTATASVTITDGTTSVTATNSATVNDGRPHKWDVAWSRTGNLTLYIDGVSGTGRSITGIGAITVDTLWVSRDQDGNYFSGQIGEKLRARYPSLPSDIASWIAYANTQRFIPEPPGGGTTVLRLFGKENSAYDQSGTQGVLTNTGSTPIIPR